MLTLPVSFRRIACRATEPSTAGTMYSRAGCAASKTFITTIVVASPATYPPKALHTINTMSSVITWPHFPAAVARPNPPLYAPVKVPAPDRLLCIIAQHDSHKDARHHDVAQAQHGKRRQCLCRSAGEEQLDGCVKRLCNCHLRERMQTTSACEEESACTM